MLQDRSYQAPLHVAVRAHSDFDTARRGAFFNELRALLLRRPNWLVAYEDMASRLPMEGMVSRGLRAIPVRAIRGSVGRYADFDREFLPRRTSTRGLWESVDRAYLSDIVLPPIDVYK